jgi:tetratricopeptide (TPR) repeat protein
MWRYKRKLEGAYQVVRLKRLRRRVFLIEGVLLVAVLLVVLAYNGASTNPFYLPLDVGLIFALAMLWVISLENFFFRNLEIRNVRRGSRKHLMTVHSMRRAGVIVATCAVLAVVLILPGTTAYATDQLSTQSTLSVDPNGQQVYRFTNQDRLGLSRTTSLEVFADGGGVNAVLGTAEDYDRDLRIDSPIVNVTITSTPSQSIIEQNAFETLVLQLVNSGNANRRVSISTQVELTQGLIVFIPVIAMLFIITNILWMAYLNPLRVQYAPTSIYSSDYEAALEAGDRTWGEISASRPKLEEGPEGPPEVKAPAPAKTLKAVPPPPPDLTQLGEVPPPPEMSKEAMVGMGQDLLQKRNFDAALRSFDKALEQDRDDPAALEGRAKALMRLKMRDDAEATLRRLREVQEDNVYALLTLADISREKGRYSRALEYYTSALNVRPEMDETWVQQGDVLLKLGRDSDAYDAYRNALKVNPDNREAREKLSLVRIDADAALKEAMDKSASGDYRGALEEYDRIIRQNPRHLMALLGKGVAYQKLDKPAAAAESLRRVLELDPTNEAALMRMASLSEDQGLWAEAVDYYDRLLEVKPGDEEALLMKGDAQAELGLLAEARETYERALKEHPDSAEARQRVEAMEVRIERTRKAAIRRLTSLPGIGPAKAKAIVAAGYDSVESLERARPSDLAKIRGVSKKLAKVVVGSFKAEGKPESGPD